MRAGVIDRRRSCTGFSLVEILLASCVIAVAVLPIITVLLSSGDSIRQTRPYYQAVFFANQVVEEARLATQEDPHFHDRLFADGYGARRASVVHGNHPFFTFLEDSGDPVGRLVPQSDWSIQPEAGPLFELAEPLAMALQAEDRDGDITCRFLFDWLDQDGRDRDYVLQTAVPRWIERDRIEAYEEPAALPDDEPATALAAILGLGILARTILDDVAATLDALPEAGSPADTARAARSRAILHEGAAARLVHIAGLLRAPVRILSRPIPAGALGTGVDEARRALDDVQTILGGLRLHLSRAASEAATAAALPGFSLGERYSAHRLALRARKLETVIRALPPASLELPCLQLADYYDGRMMHASHYFRVEARAVLQLDGSYALGPAARDVIQVQQSLIAMSASLIRYILEAAAASS